MTNYEILNDKLKEAQHHCRGSGLYKELEKAVCSNEVRDKINAAENFISFSRIHHVGQKTRAGLVATFEGEGIKLRID